MIGYYWSGYKVFWYLYTMFCTLLYFNYLGMMIVSITPSFPVAAILQSSFYTMLNLFSGFLIPRPVSIFMIFCSETSWNYFISMLLFLNVKVWRSEYYIGFTLQQIPKWWIWLYYLTPTSWSLNGLLTSQYGDIDQEINVFEDTKTVAEFLRDYFGFHHNELPLVAVILILYPLLFASIFAYCMGKLNFQRR